MRNTKLGYAAPDSMTPNKRTRPRIPLATVSLDSLSFIVEHSLPFMQYFVCFHLNSTDKCLYCTMLFLSRHELFYYPVILSHACINTTFLNYTNITEGKYTLDVLCVGFLIDMHRLLSYTYLSE